MYGERRRLKLYYRVTTVVDVLSTCRFVGSTHTARRSFTFVECNSGDSHAVRPPAIIVL